MIRNYQCRVKQ